MEESKAKPPRSDTRRDAPRSHALRWNEHPTLRLASVPHITPRSQTPLAPEYRPSPPEQPFNFPIVRERPPARFPRTPFAHHAVGQEIRRSKSRGSKLLREAGSGK